MAVKRRRASSSREEVKKAPRGSKKSASKKPTQDDGVEYESMREAKPEGERAEKFKLEDKKQKKRIGFPLATPDGSVAMVKVHYFKAKFNTTLADGKWHAFQAPQDEDLLAECRKHPNLDEKTERATIVIVYDTDSKGKVYGKGADINYELLSMKINNPKLIELQDIDEDDDLTAVDLTVTLDKSKDVKFQDMRFKVAGDALWSDEMEMEDIQAEAKALSIKLKEAVANKYDDDKIEALIGDGDDEEDDYDEDEDYDDEEYDDDEIDGEEEDEEEDEEEEPAPKKSARKKTARRSRR